MTLCLVHYKKLIKLPPISRLLMIQEWCTQNHGSGCANSLMFDCVESATEGLNHRLKESERFRDENIKLKKRIEVLEDSLDLYPGSESVKSLAIDFAEKDAELRRKRRKLDPKPLTPAQLACMNQI